MSCGGDLLIVIPILRPICRRVDTHRHITCYYVTASNCNFVDLFNEGSEISWESSPATLRQWICPCGYVRSPMFYWFALPNNDSVFEIAQKYCRFYCCSIVYVVIVSSRGVHEMLDDLRLEQQTWQLVSSLYRDRLDSQRHIDIDQDIALVSFHVLCFSLTKPLENDTTKWCFMHLSSVVRSIYRDGNKLQRPQTMANWPWRLQQWKREELMPNVQMYS